MVSNLWAASWDVVPAELKNVVRMVWLPANPSFFKAEPLSTPPKLDGVISELLSLPEGKRYLFAWYFGQGLHSDPKDAFADGSPSPWIANAILKAGNQFNAMLASIAKRVRIDGVVLDSEDHGQFSSWSINLAKLVSDKRFAATQSSKIIGSEIKDPSLGFQSNYIARYAWDTENGRIFASYANRNLANRTRPYFPNCKFCNYQGCRVTAENAVPDQNGHSYPSDSLVGTSNSPALYGAINQLGTVAAIDTKDPTKTFFGEGPRIERTPWGSFLTDVQTARAVTRSSTAGLQPWVASPLYAGEKGEVYYPSDPRYHEEMLRHVSLLNIENFLYFNPFGMFTRLTAGGGTATSNKQAEDGLYLDGVLGEINATIAGRDRKILTTDRLSWLSDVVISSVGFADGTSLLRVTVKPGINQVVLDGKDIIKIPDGTVGTWVSWGSHKVPTVSTKSNVNEAS